MVNAHSRNNDMQLLHPVVREAVAKVQAVLDAESIPLKVFEAFRFPERQADLYAQGRTKPGGIVTHAEPWRSYLQYGLAVDFVIYEQGQWSWDTSGAKAKWWSRMHELGKQNGLAPLDFETPHLQLAGTSSNALYHGVYPAGGNDIWSETLAAVIAGWRGSPGAPLGPPTLSRPVIVRA